MTASTHKLETNCFLKQTCTFFNHHHYLAILNKTITLKPSPWRSPAPVCKKKNKLKGVFKAYNRGTHIHRYDHAPLLFLISPGSRPTAIWWYPPLPPPLHQRKRWSGPENTACYFDKNRKKKAHLFMEDARVFIWFQVTQSSWDAIWYRLSLRETHSTVVNI